MDTPTAGLDRVRDAALDRDEEECRAASREALPEIAVFIKAKTFVETSRVGNDLPTLCHRRTPSGDCLRVCGAAHAGLLPSPSTGSSTGACGHILRNE